MTEQNFDVDRALDAELEHNVFTERRRKLAEIREQGVAYPNDFKRTALFGDLSEKFADATAEELERNPVSVAVSGRMMLKRVMGRASFATVRDFTGTMQYFVAEENVGEAAYAEFKTLDLGDIVAAKGTLMRTRMGELAVRVTEIRLMSKCLRPLPDKYKGLADTERCYRQRYVDLIVNEESRKRFLVRSRAIAAVRQYMIDSRFLEVETPMLHPIPGGANARPFVTHHNALDMDIYLRIAPYKQRVIGSSPIGPMLQKNMAR